MIVTKHPRRRIANAFGVAGALTLDGLVLTLDSLALGLV